MSKSNEADLIGRLSESLGVALEFSFAPTEFKTLWPEAIEALSEAAKYLRDRGAPVPRVVTNVLKNSQAG